MSLAAPRGPATRRVSARQAEALDRLFAADWAEAVANAPAEAAGFARVIAGYHADFRIIGRQWSGQVESVLAHLPHPEAGSTPGLTLELVDRAAAGLGEPGSALDAMLAPGEGTTASTDGCRVIQRRGSTVLCLDRKRNRIAGWTRAAEQLSLTDRGRPFDPLLFLWLHDRGLMRLHAGLVAENGAGALVGGGSGSGKTTTVLACLQDGFDFVGEDRVAIEAQGDGGYVAHGIHQSAFVLPESLNWFPGLERHAVAGSSQRDDKVLLPLSEAFPGRPRASARLALVLLPRVRGGTQLALRPARKSDALLRLAPSGLWVHSGAAWLDDLAVLVQRLPCYWLELGAPAEIARAVRAVLHEVSTT